MLPPLWSQPRSRLMVVLVVILALATRAGAQPSVVGQWSSVLQWPVGMNFIHATLTPDGKVVFWRSPGSNSPPTPTYVWNPSTPATNPVSVGSAPRSIYCSGHALLPDGRLLTMGGDNSSSSIVGIPDAYVFDPSTQAWTAQDAIPDMEFQRWYPTATVLPDGQVLATSGWTIEVVWNTRHEVYNPALNCWRTMNNAAAQLAVPLYPFMFVLPTGQLFMAGPSPDTNRTTRYLSVTPSGPDCDDAVTGTWTTATGSSFVEGGSAVMYRASEIVTRGGDGSVTVAPAAKILKSGSIQPFSTPYTATAAAAVFDSSASPVWRSVTAMNHARKNHYLVVLPDGTVLAVGGSTDGQRVVSEANYAVGPAELWDPADESWTDMAALDTASAPRLYHSVALLLPDGKVLSAGGDPQMAANDAQVYSPPYLFNGDRPVITAEPPASVSYAESFVVGLQGGTTLDSVALVRLGSSTHAFDQHQRYVAVGFNPVPGGIRVTAPPNANVAPPGHYMLFLVGTNGVPSVARFVHVSACDDNADCNDTNSCTTDVCTSGACVHTCNLDNACSEGCGTTCQVLSGVCRCG